MKKITLLAFALSIPVFTMAYGYDDYLRDSYNETISQIIMVIGGIFGLLSLILFFKMWGMTNDIRKFRNKYIGNSTPVQTSIGSKYLSLHVLRGAECARESFLSVLEEELSAIYEKCTSEDNAAELLQEIENKYKVLLESESIDLKGMLKMESIFCDKYLEFKVGDVIKYKDYKYNVRNIKPY